MNNRTLDEIIDGATTEAVSHHFPSPKAQPTKYFAHQAKGLSSNAEKQLNEIWRMRKMSKTNPAWIDAIAKLHTEAGDDRFKGMTMEQLLAIAGYAAQGKVKTDSYYQKDMAGQDIRSMMNKYRQRMTGMEIC